MPAPRAGRWSLAKGIPGPVGCGGLDTGKAQDKIKEGIEKQTGVKVKSVACPDNVELKKGDTFNCTATASDGSKATVKVTQTSDSGDIRYELQQ